MRVDELASPPGDTFKFENIGDTIEGTVVYVGNWQEYQTKFGPKISLKLGIDTGNGEIRYIWPGKGSNMAQRIAEALRNADIPELVEGQTIKVRYASDQDIGKGDPMKVFQAKVTAANPRATEDPF